MSLKKDLKVVCNDELNRYRTAKKPERKLRKAVGNLADLSSAAPLREIFNRQSPVVRRAAKALENNESSLYVWTVIPLAAVGFGTAFATILSFWAYTEMDAKGGQKKAAKKKVDRMIDRTVWAYCLTVGKP